MKKLKRLLAASAVLGLLVGAGSRADAACANTDVQCYVVGGTQVFRVDSAGNQTITGTNAVTGASTLTGALTTGGAITAGGVITTASATPYSLIISSANMNITTSTPTVAGIVGFNSSYLVYVSTCTTSTFCWAKVGAQ